jgi:hypothetical protein
MYFSRAVSPTYELPRYLSRLRPSDVRSSNRSLSKSESRGMVIFYGDGDSSGSDGRSAISTEADKCL